MYNYTNKYKGYIYNQNKSNDFGSDCIPASMFQILGLTYDVWLNYKVFNKLVDHLIAIGQLLKWGGSFSVVYKTFEGLIESFTGFEVTTKTLSINSNEFVLKLKKGYAFGLGLKNGNSTYLGLARKGECLTNQDIDNILKQGGGFGHNHVYCFENGAFMVYEVYTGTKFEMPLEVLKYALSKGLYYSNTRTFELEDKKLEQALFDYKEGKIIDLTNNPDANYYNKASQLRIFKEKYNKNQ